MRLRLFSVLIPATAFSLAGLFSTDVLADDPPEAKRWLGDFNGDGFTDFVATRPLRECGRGEVDVVYGRDPTGGSTTGVDTTFSRSMSTILGTAECHDYFGADVGVGDFDGDGYDDIVVGVPGDNPSSVDNGGSIHILYGSSTGITDAGDQLFHQNSANIFDFVEADDFFGDSVAVGDFDCDGYDDVAVGVPHENVGSIVDGGAVHTLFGGSTGISSVSNQLWREGSDSIGVGGSFAVDDNFGFGLAAGNFDADGSGCDDLAIGVPGDDALASNSGRVYVMPGTTSGLTKTGVVTLEQGQGGLSGVAAADDRFGREIGTGDPNDDGYEDVLVQVPGEGGDLPWVHEVYGGTGGVGFGGNNIVDPLPCSAVYDDPLGEFPLIVSNVADGWLTAAGGSGAGPGGALFGPNPWDEYIDAVRWNAALSQKVETEDPEDENKVIVSYPNDYAWPDECVEECFGSRIEDLNASGINSPGDVRLTLIPPIPAFHKNDPDNETVNTGTMSDKVEALLDKYVECANGTLNDNGFTCPAAFEMSWVAGYAMPEEPQVLPCGPSDPPAGWRMPIVRAIADGVRNHTAGRSTFLFLQSASNPGTDQVGGFYWASRQNGLVCGEPPMASKFLLDLRDKLEQFWFHRRFVGNPKVVGNFYEGDNEYAVVESLLSLGDPTPVAEEVWVGNYTHLMLDGCPARDDTRILAYHRSRLSNETTRHVNNLERELTGSCNQRRAIHAPDLTDLTADERLDQTAMTASEGRHDFWAGIHYARGVHINNVFYTDQQPAAWDEYKDALRLLKTGSASPVTPPMRDIIVDGGREVVVPGLFGSITNQSVPGDVYADCAPGTNQNGSVYAMPDDDAIHATLFRDGSSGYLVVTNSYEHSGDIGYRISFTGSPTITPVIGAPNDPSQCVPAAASNEVCDVFADHDAHVYYISWPNTPEERPIDAYWIPAEWEN